MNRSVNGFILDVLGVVLLVGFASATGLSQPIIIDEDAKILASDGATWDFFGSAVSVSGDVMVIGAPYDDDSGSSSGSAYIYRYDGTTWVEEAKLIASDGEPQDYFGGFYESAVAASGDVVVVGALGAGDLHDHSGAAYIFRFDGSQWVEEAKLLASDGGPGDEFGKSVSVSGDVVMIGADNHDDLGPNTGAAYVFRYDGISWVEEAELLSPEGDDRDYFGYAVSVDGDVALIGTPYGEDYRTWQGEAYVFRYDDTEWVMEQKLRPYNPAIVGNFGNSVSISGDVAAVGRYRYNALEGSVQVFRFDGATWNRETRDLQPQGLLQIADYFGYSVSLSGDVLLVGAPGDRNHGTATGSAYLYRYDGAEWIEYGQLLHSDAAERDTLGYSVSVDGDVTVIGAPHHDDQGNASGAAYVFEGVSTGLFLTDPIPGEAGTDNKFEVQSATPGARVHFLYGLQSGSTGHPNCPDATAGILSPIVAGSAVADSSGYASITAFVPDRASGETVLFQTVELSNCRVSNIVDYRFP